MEGNEVRFKGSSQDISVSTAMEYGFNGRTLIPGQVQEHSTPQRPHCKE
jgi:hypothetical protein